MTLCHRLMRPGDVSTCADIVRTHPVIGPRYGCAIGDLAAAWLRLLGTESHRSIVLEEADRNEVRICGVGVTAFVADSFLREVKGPPPKWLGPELAKRIARDRYPLLSEKQLREANSEGGLNLLIWEVCTRPADADRPALLNRILSSLIETHRGFLWKEVIGGQAESVERLQTMLKAGSLMWNPQEGRYEGTPVSDPEKTVSAPHLFGITRDASPHHLVSWLGTLFDYHPPRFGFSQSEQKLLKLALAGGTDQELSADLGISLSGVKKIWVAIHRRIAKGGLETPPNETTDEWWLRTVRGKEKKRRLLAYLQAHSEELCPISRKHFRRPSQREHPVVPAGFGAPAADFDEFRKRVQAAPRY